MITKVFQRSILQLFFELLLLLIASSTSALAAGTKADSLKQMLQRTEDASQHQVLLFELVDVLLSENPEEAILFCNSSINSQAYGSAPCVQAKLHLKLGYAYDQQGQEKIALKVLKEGLQRAVLCPGDTVRPYLYLDIANIYSNLPQGQLYYQDSILFYRDKCLEHLAGLSDFGQLKLRILLNSLLAKAKQYEAALKNGLALEARFDSLPAKHPLRVRLYEMLGNLYIEENDYETAVHYFSAILPLLDPAEEKDQISYYQQFLGYLYKKKAGLAATETERRQWLQKAIMVLEESLDHTVESGLHDKALYSLQSIANAYAQLQQNEKAIQLFMRGYEYAREVDNHRHAFSIAIGIADLELSRGKAALPLRILAEVKTHISEQSLYNQSAYYNNLAKALQLNGSGQEANNAYQKALSLLYRHNRQRDSLLNATNIQQLKEQEVRYQTQRKEQEILFLKEQEKNQKLKLQNRTAWLALAAFFLVTSFVFLLLINRDRWRTARQNKQLTALNQKLGRFTHSVSHDMLSKLDMILTSYYMYQRKAGSTGAKQYLDNINHTTHWLKTYIQDLLDWANREEDPTAATSLQQLTDDVLLSYQSKIRARKLDIEKLNLEVQLKIDEAPLRQIMHNLIDNAIKYTQVSERAIIRISCENTQFGAVVSVEDNGPGISAEQLALIKDKKRNQRHGLKIVNSILRNYNQELMIGHSQELGGAKFSFTLNT